MHIIVKQRDNQRKNFDLKLDSTHAPVLWAAKQGGLRSMSYST